MDEGKLRQKIVIDLASRPVTLIPGLIGITLLLGLWTISMWNPIAVTVATFCLLAAAGTFLTGFFGSAGSKVAKKVAADLREDLVKHEQDALDELDEQLTKDRDPRTQALLRDLRALVIRFKEGSTDEINATISFDIITSVDELFKDSIRLLRKTLELYETAKEISTSSAKRTILDKRTRIIEDVRASVDQLGKILADIQVMEIGDNSQQGEIRRQLADSLQIAKDVKAEMAAWDRDELKDLVKEKAHGAV